MKYTVLKMLQSYLIEMFFWVKNKTTLSKIKKVPTTYYAQKVEEGMDELWEKGEWTQEKNEAILKEHLRTPYQS